MEDGTSRGRELRVLWCFWVMSSSGASAFQPGLEQVSYACSLFGACAFQPGLVQITDISKWKTGPVTDVSYACTLFWCCMFSNHGHELCVFSAGEDGTSRGRELPPFNQDVSK